MQSQPFDPFDLDRFTAAQASVYERVLEELRAGEKRSHWMWFIFPQIRGLGTSSVSRRYAIASQAEARAYLAHPVLGDRLVECTAIVNGIANRSATEIFGWPDELKFGSCMTLFATVAGPASMFSTASIASSTESTIRLRSSSSRSCKNTPQTQVNWQYRIDPTEPSLERLVHCAPRS